MSWQSQKVKSQKIFILVCSLNIYNTYYRHSVKLLPHGPNTHYRHGSDSANMLKLNIYMYKVRFLISTIDFKNFPSIRGVSLKRYDIFSRGVRLSQLLFLCLIRFENSIRSLTYKSQSNILYN